MLSGYFQEGLRTILSSTLLYLHYGEICKLLCSWNSHIASTDTALLIIARSYYICIHLYNVEYYS